LRSDNRNVNGW